MSATNPGPGRPPGKDPETLKRVRRMQAMERKGWTIAEIAECEDVKERYVRMLLDEAAAEPDAGANAKPAAPPRKLSRRTAHYRAWEYADSRPVFDLGLGVNSFWARIVVTIHEDGEGFSGGDAGVCGSPLVLIEGLEDGGVLGEGLAQAEGKDEFAVGEVGDDFSG